MSRYFRDDQQSARACRTLLATANLERLWSERGPTDEAHSIFASRGAELDTGARATFLAAWAFWSGDGALPLADLLAATNVEAICSLCVAVTSGPQAVDAWLTRVWFGPGYLDEKNIHAQAAALFDEARAVFAELDDEVFDLRNPADACALGALQMYRYWVLRRRVEEWDDDDIPTDVDGDTAATSRFLGLLALQERELSEGHNPDV
jgi:hypothetical protein